MNSTKNLIFILKTLILIHKNYFRLKLLKTLRIKNWKKLKNSNRIELKDRKIAQIINSPLEEGWAIK